MNTLSYRSTIAGILCLWYSLPIQANNHLPGSALQYQQTTNTRIAVEDNFLRFFTGNLERMTIDGSGKVGIGTASPNYPLTVRSDKGIDAGNHKVASLTRIQSGDGNAGVNISYEADGTAVTRTKLYFPGSVGVTFQLYDGGAKDVLYLNPNGNVGIGTISPESKFHVEDNSGSKFGFVMKNVHNSGHGLLVQGGGTSGSRFIMQLKDAAGTDRLTVTDTGEVGIGTTSPSYKLHVSGQVKGTAFISSTTTYADFVFEDDYKLPALAEVEKFIEKNNHLPEIPSEEEARANGVNLQEMQAKLLQKIEELTLYVIELKKENESQQQEIEKLKQQE